MLKDLILTLALLCVCFVLIITLNNWQFSAQTNLLISSIFGGVSKSMLTLNEAIIDVKKG